jgi:hypothetical protein
MSEVNGQRSEVRGKHLRLEVGTAHRYGVEETIEVDIMCSLEVGPPQVNPE